MPTFFVAEHGLDLAASPFSLAVPYLAGFIGLIFAGRVSDALVRHGIRTRTVRKGVQLVAALGLGLLLQLSSRAGSAGWAAVWMTLALFFGRMQSAAFWVNMVDVCPESAATVMGLSNSLATLPGILGQTFTQALLEASFPWSAVFGLPSLVGLATSLLFVVMADDKSLDVPRPEKELEGDPEVVQEVAEGPPRPCKVGKSAALDAAELASCSGQC
eukprot:gnl/TRDRNA2_/TRDRNA2_67400_c1_seq1.p1 gnl/TRDRNA2_/TRDRNA2_67400_c1~~gnl/TRDRNA2_/TRDRNA2_67400_c1_seq1.p1  ORF type:complete len:216 (+),score=38.53 gnl/TRDRNA2_/TRDRNA2_67400_c1_seq1:1-648(+)